MFTTYILKSLKDQGYYFGHCAQMDVRLQRHNDGRVKSTKGRRPFVVHYSEQFLTRAEAQSREMFFKTLEGRNWLKSNSVI